MERRALDTPELRTFSDFEARQQADGSWKVGGYASTFNDPYQVHDRFGDFSEEILPGTWDRTLSERGHKIQLLESHGGLPYASTKAKNLRLGTDQRGLDWEALLPKDSQRAQDLGVGIRDGYIDEMSVGMRIPTEGDSWNADMTERQISEATLLEISVVARGANPNTEAAMREQELLAEIRELRAAIATEEANSYVPLRGGTITGALTLDVDQSVTLDANLDSLRDALAERKFRLPITKELAQLLERRK